MPETTICFFREASGDLPFLEWMEELKSCNERAATKCLYLLDLPGQFGHELRRTQSDLLRDGVYRITDQSWGE